MRGLIGEKKVMKYVEKRDLRSQRLRRKASMIEEMRENEKLVISVGSGSRALRNQ